MPTLKLRKPVDKSLLQPWCGHSNTISDIQLQKTIVLRTQPRRQATSTQENYVQERGQNDAWTRSSTARPVRPRSRFKRACFKTVRRTSSPIHLPGHVLSCKTQHLVHPLSLKNAFRARLPSRSESGRNGAFVRDIPEKSKWKMWKRSFRARPRSKSDSRRCENGAFVPDVPEKWKWKMWKRSFDARPPKKTESGRCENEAFVRHIPQKVKAVKMWKRSSRARLPSRSKSGRCENEAFVPDFPEKVEVEDVKTKLSCETSLKIRKWQMWKQRFRARLPSRSESGRCESEAFVRDFPSCETALKIRKWQMWKRSFHARLPS